MKKVIVSILMIGGLVIPASARMKAKAKKAGNVPYAENQAIDHSKDVAYSAQWADQAISPAQDADFRMGAEQSINPAVVVGRTYYYSYPLSNYTLYSSQPVTMNAPYMGQDAPSYDGAARNAYRNIRANNESEVLPSNSGR